MQKKIFTKCLVALFCMVVLMGINMERSEAKRSITLHPYYSEYVTYTINRSPGVTAAVDVYFTNVAGRNNYVKLTDGSGNYIWEGRIGTYKELWLGFDHKQYRIYVRSNGGPRTTGTVNFSVRSGSAGIR